jgi:CRISPR-associated endonuclease/helicase Cas3
MSKRALGKSGGVVLTSELIDQLADEAEAGYDPGRLRPRKGRPRMGSKAAAVFQVRLEPELREALERAAAGQRTSPSELARRALRRYLKRAAPRKKAQASRS